MIRITSATHSACCADCRDKSALNIAEPCRQHAAAARGLRLSWRPAVVTAWGRLAEPPTYMQPPDGVPTAWQRPVAAKHPTDLWKAFR